ncbi:MAG: Stp1/IreP family PP2C-type Ser/Thr phosphatase [Vulcanimicrobiaceae bacterium]
MEVAFGSELGLLRGVTSDAHVVESLAPGIALVAVADGFGAVGRGDATGPLALATVRDFVRRRHRAGSFSHNISSSGVRSILLSALDHANARVYEQSGSHEDFVASGTSLTVVLLVGAHAFVGHVGDARAYLARLGGLEMLTADDAMFADPAVTGAKMPSLARPRTRGLLWRSLGTQPKLEASISHVDLVAGDRLLLCTDGAHRCLDDAEMCAALGEDDAASEIVARLLATVRSRGNLDQATIVLASDVLAASPSPNSARATRLRPLRIALAVVTIVALLFGGALAVRVGYVDRTAYHTLPHR